jgi:hypothetical protein
MCLGDRDIYHEIRLDGGQRRRKRITIIPRTYLQVSRCLRRCLWSDIDPTSQTNIWVCHEVFGPCATHAAGADKQCIELLHSADSFGVVLL